MHNSIYYAASLRKKHCFHINLNNTTYVHTHGWCMLPNAYTTCNKRESESDYLTFRRGLLAGSCTDSTTGIKKCTTAYPGASGACLELATCKTTNPNVANTDSCTGANVKACDSPFGRYCCAAGQDAPTIVSGVCQCKPSSASTLSVYAWVYALAAGLLSLVHVFSVL